MFFFCYFWSLFDKIWYFWPSNMNINIPGSKISNVIEKLPKTRIFFLIFAVFFMFFVSDIQQSLFFVWFFWGWLLKSVVVLKLHPSLEILPRVSFCCPESWHVAHSPDMLPRVLTCCPKSQHVAQFSRISWKCIKSHGKLN